MKISYQGREIEITEIRFAFGDEATIQEGVLVHDSADEFGDGDAIYGNGWTLDMIHDAADLESLFTSGDGSTYFYQSANGTYRVEA